MAPRREAIPEADVEPAARPLVAVDGRDEGDGGGVEKRRQAADRERGCLVDDDGVRIVGEPTRLDGGEKSHAAAAGRGDGVIVATCQFSQRSEQGRGALEHLRGVAVGGGGDEDVPARGGEATAVGLDDDGGPVAQALERREGVGLIGRETRVVGFGGKGGAARDRRRRVGPGGPRVGQPVALDGSRVHVDDGDPRMCAEGVDQPAAEVPGHVRGGSGRDRESLVGVVGAGPRVERRCHEDEEAAAVDGADDAPEDVR